MVHQQILQVCFLDSALERYATRFTKILEFFSTLRFHNIGFRISKLANVHHFLNRCHHSWKVLQVLSTLEKITFHNTNIAPCQWLGNYCTSILGKHTFRGYVSLKDIREGGRSNYENLGVFPSCCINKKNQ